MAIVYNEVDGDLITLAQKGSFDVIAHGANCMNTMGAGVAVPMANAFGCDKFPLEAPEYYADINKLGQIDYQILEDTEDPAKTLTVVNAYTQYNFGRNHKGGDQAPFDYHAFTLCMKKINKLFAGKHLGIPKIGSHLAGGDWDVIKNIIHKTLTDMTVTVVNFVS